MADPKISNQLSKILSRFDRTLSSSPSFVKTLNYSEPVPTDTKNPSSVLNPPPSLQRLRALYHDPAIKHLKPESPRSLTPDVSSFNLRSDPKLTNSSSTCNSTSVINLTAQFQPKLSKNSLKITSKLGLAKKRLLTVPSAQVIKEEGFSFKPKINEKSQRMDKKKQETEFRWNALYEQGREKQKDMEKMRFEIGMQKSLKEVYAFKPKVLMPSQNKDTNVTIERLENWAKSKELKMKEKKDVEADKDMKECTFAPKLFQSQLSSDDLSSIKGVNRYVLRGQKIKLDQSQELSQTSTSANKDMSQRKYKEFVQALHEELYSLDL